MAPRLQFTVQQLRRGRLCRGIRALSSASELPGAPYDVYQHPEPLALDYGSFLPSFELGYETWGTLNADASNAILLHGGLSASSHAASTPQDPRKGWWEAFIGPGKGIDTDKFFVICTNVLGGCHGSTGPSSLVPSSMRKGNLSPTSQGTNAIHKQRYGTDFPIISIFDMIRAQFKLLNHLKIHTIHASVGGSMGGMQSLAAGHLYPHRVGKIVSISSTARTSPSSIAIRFAQRSVLMSDPNWRNGFYYDSQPPIEGMRLARRTLMADQL